MLIGIILVVVFLSILILVHELGHFLSAKKFGLLVEEFGIGLPPRIFGKKIGETIYSINWLPFGGFVKIYGENGEDKSDKDVQSSKNFSFLPAWKRGVILFAGVFMNFLLGWLVVSLVFAMGAPESILITDVSSGGPAEVAGLESGDRIVSFAKIEEFQSFINENLGKEITVRVEHLGEVSDFVLTPRVEIPEGEGPLGLVLIQAGFPKSGVVKSLADGFVFSVKMIGVIFQFLFDLISRAFVGKADFSQVAGPVGIVKITYQAGAMGLIYILQLLALISLNLTVLNILPFPALDGGRLLFLLIEKIKGSPLPLKFEKYANAIGMLILIILMIAITVKDVGGLI